MQKVKCIGYAYGKAAEKQGCEKGPLAIQAAFLKKNDTLLEWVSILTGPETAPKLAAIDSIAKISYDLARQTALWTKNNENFLVFGGDHTSAIGTWSGVAHALANQGNIGLIWIDAHMDSHTPETSFSKNVHGMPLAVLLGYGDPRLTDLLNFRPKVRPESICLIGVRDGEKGETELLKDLGVRIFFMEEVKEHGLAAIWQEAINHVNQDTIGYGISLDIDSIDPKDAPGTGARVPDGIVSRDLCECFKTLSKDKRLLGLEISEFDPDLDEDHKTENLIIQLVNAVFSR